MAGQQLLINYQVNNMLTSQANASLVKVFIICYFDIYFQDSGYFGNIYFQEYGCFMYSFGLNSSK